MSQFDSMMEPLEDEFHAGLDFHNARAQSVNNSTYTPDLNRAATNADDTDEDIEDLPIEETDGSTRYANIASLDSPRHSGKKPIEASGFEFVDKKDLNNVTDEEINEQNTGQSKKGIGAMLGF